MKQIKVKISLLTPSAVIPGYSTEHAAGMDLHNVLKTPMKIKPGEIKLVPTGISVEIPVGYEGQVRPRSGLALKHGISIVNAPGTIDADYRGEVGVIIINLGRKGYVIQPGDRIAQLVISPVAKAVMVKTMSLKTTARGKGGFGHTGTGYKNIKRTDK